MFRAPRCHGTPTCGWRRGRRALEEIAARQRAADEKSTEEAERRQQADVPSESVVVKIDLSGAIQSGLEASATLKGVGGERRS